MSSSLPSVSSEPSLMQSAEPPSPEMSAIRRILRAILTALLSLIIIAGAASPFVAVQYQKHVFAERVHTYLIQQKHYTADELSSVKGIWGMMLPAFYVEVIFKDEPERVYTYFAHGEVTLMSHRLIHSTDPIDVNETDTSKGAVPKHLE